MSTIMWEHGDRQITIMTKREHGAVENRRYFMCVTCLHENDTVYTSLASLACTMLFTLGRREEGRGCGRGRGRGLEI